ncbi:MAG: hypothetical protein RBS72_10035 [Sedimentisphaerales bacterium]|nr:hypothetical protein [Sedimentisphaerales bacterium]HNY80852.1 hypothetical protein [Sedimentisphaerales bacterium]HOC61774.1 hypothetical protein [Sedimentisphaerales bacterium]HOH66750.1 hypothetical protein [Sedimentisphaerales bacterium]HPY49135.1 hypothetical protein [Sedimentisphaerales bacterium]
MNSPFAKLAIAAAVVIAGVMGLFLWTGTQSSVALADVLTRLQQVNAYMYQMTILTTGSGVGDTPAEHEARATALISQELGMKMTMEMDTRVPGPDGAEPMLQETYMLLRQRKEITLMPGQKKYMQIDFDDALVEETRKQNNDPRAMVEEILNCNYVSLGRSVIEGVEVEGFQTTDPNYLGGMMGEVDVRIWVDVKTQLPVRSEMDMQMTNDMHMHAVIHGFAWDVSVDASEFEPVIPDDYTTLGGGPLQMPAMNEETAIQGLRLFAELSGRYPEKLDMVTLMSVTKDLAKRSVADGHQPEKDDMDERIKELTQTLAPVVGIGSFYMSLSQDQKHPAYYGDVVTPEDADQVLMRWQVSETEYRVIFGSLHVETVSAEVLAELEKTLPRP